MTLFSWCYVLSRPLRGAQLWVGALLLCLASFTVTAEETTEAPSWDNLTQALQLDPSDSADRTSPLAAPQNDSAHLLTAPALPFMVDASFSDDTVHFTISMASGAYIYRDSIVLTSNSGSLLLAQPNLPEAIEHEDSMGTHLVYFDELQFDASILSAQAGDELTLSYQGCDAQGICYPPQNYSVELIKDVKVSYTKLDQAAQNTTTPAQPTPQSAEPSASQSLWSLLSTETEGSAISDFITQNLGIGLLLCFLLGIGLDLTPCVLPMLPIFSALIVSKPRGGKPVSFAILLRQNLGYALGLSLCYMVLACADLIELKVPSFITGPLQERISKVNTKSMGGAFALGVVSAIIASPCTSAPLAGALLYVMQSGNTLMGALVFFVIGLGMATPLLIIGLFGGRYLMKGGMVGDLVKRLLAVVLLFAAYFITRHLMGQAEPFILSLTVFIASLYVIGTIIYFIIKHRLTLTWVGVTALLALLPTYLSYHALFSQVRPEAVQPYEGFTKVTSLSQLQALQKNGPAFVTFTASWCTNCRYMAHHIYNQAEFLTLSAGLTRIVIDISDANNPQTRELINHFRVIGVPYIVTLDDQGQIHSSHIGLASSEMVRNIVLDLKNTLD